MNEMTCRLCLGDIPRRSGHGTQKLYCDRCWDAHNLTGGRRWLVRTCPVCGEPSAFNRTYCDAHRGQPTEPAPPRVCPCGQPATGRMWYCSPDCRTTARREASTRSRKTPAARDRQRTREQAKNAEDKPHRKPEWKRVRLLVLADHPPCGICGDPIDYALKFPDPMSPSVDHIVSWRRGGAWFDLANLRAAHFRCNAGRREDVA